MTPDYPKQSPNVNNRDKIVVTESDARKAGAWIRCPGCQNEVLANAQRCSFCSMKFKKDYPHVKRHV